VPQRMIDLARAKLRMAATTTFDHEQFDHAYPAGIENSWWNVARNFVLSSELARARRSGLISASPRIIEIGCGRGIVVRYLLSRGWDVWGIELATPTPIGDTRDRVITGTDARDLPLAFRASVECIMLLDVIEHIQDAPAFMRNVLASFPNAKTAVVTVPARPEAWSNYDDYYRHFCRHTPSSLRHELSLGGLRPIRVRYFFHSLYFVAIAINLTRRQRAVNLSPPARIGWHRFIAMAMWLEHKIFGPIRFVPGLSLLALARRPEADAGGLSERRT
jgi:Methyltransferase domain